MCAVLADGLGRWRDACAVDQTEKRPELERGGNNGLRVRFLRDVTMQVALPEFRGERLASLVLNVGKHDARAGLRQHAGGACAKA